MQGASDKKTLCNEIHSFNSSDLIIVYKRIQIREKNNEYFKKTLVLTIARSEPSW